jgi:hypothetical protein
MDNFPTTLQLVLVVVLIARMVHLFQIHRRARLGENDRSQEGREGPRVHPWGWAQPTEDLGLGLRETSNRSVLILPAQRTAVEFIGVLLGYLALLGALPVLLNLSTDGGLLTIGLMTLALLLWIGWTLLHSGSPLVQIELSSNELAFVIRYGIFFLRSIRYSHRRARPLHFRHKLQSVLSMDSSQETPIVFLFAGKPRHPERRFIANCSPDAASWIVGGLEAWVLGETGKSHTPGQDPPYGDPATTT